MNDLARIASWCARAGWPVFPLADRGKIPRALCTACQDRPHDAADCPHPPETCHGYAIATTDLAQVTAWWGRHPRANVGIATGGASHLLVVDLDAHGGVVPDHPLPGHPQVGPEGIRNGLDVFAALCEVHEAPWPVTLEVATPNDGRHLYFGVTDPAAWRNTAKVLGWSIDTRGTGGYVVAPGSVTRTGAYRRISPGVDVAPLPAWLAGELAPPAAPVARQIPPTRIRTTGTGPLPGLVRYVLDAAGSGDRNTRLNWAAHRAGEHIAAGRLDRRATVAALLTAGEHIGLGDRESERTVISGIASGLKKAGLC